MEKDKGIGGSKLETHLQPGIVIFNMAPEANLYHLHGEDVKRQVK